MSCEFCDGAGKALCRAELNGMVADVQIVNRKLVADLFRDYMEMEIKFCPMCGEPLTEPQPLTLDELRGMDGEPVYCDGDWYIVWTNDDNSIWLQQPLTLGAPINGITDYRETSSICLEATELQVYRRPPKEDTL